MAVAKKPSSFQVVAPSAFLTLQREGSVEVKEFAFGTVVPDTATEDCVAHLLAIGFIEPKE